MKQYHFTGDIKELIPAGYKFQKLFAMDYKSYCKNKIIMFVVSKMVLEIDNIKSADQATVIKFILDNKEQPSEFWQYKSTHKVFTKSLFPCWVIQDGLIVSHREARDKKVAFFKRFDLDENTPYQEDGERITLELVNDILELNEIKPLELREAL